MQHDWVKSETPTQSWKARLYDRYTSSHVTADAQELRPQLAARMPYLRRMLRIHMPPERDVRVLDLGCGYGALLVALREAGYINTLGVDVSAEQIAAARTLGDFHLLCDDLLDFLRRQPSDSFDVVFALDVLEHFTRPELIDLVDEVARVLTPGGRFLVHVPNGEALDAGVIRYGDLTHELAFTPSSLRQLANACGLTLTDWFEDKPIPHGAFSVARRLLWELLTIQPRLRRTAETGRAYRSHIVSQNLLALMRKR
ncbi:MAG TPA: methyltransferase domain-containing protein [Terriglobales bacterium]